MAEKENASVFAYFERRTVTEEPDARQPLNPHDLMDISATT
jgi:hypothetical protein